jgi:hypothetical protein
VAFAVAPARLTGRAGDHHNTANGDKLGDAFADPVKADNLVPLCFARLRLWSQFGSCNRGLKPLLAASERLAIEAYDWAVRTSGVLSANPKRVKVFDLRRVFPSVWIRVRSSQRLTQSSAGL